MTTRRKFVAGAIVAAVATSSRRSRAQASVQIRISTAAPPSDFLTKALNQVKADVNRRCGTRRQRASGLDAVQAGHRGSRHSARQSRNEHDDHLRGGTADPAARLFQPRLSLRRLRPEAARYRRTDRPRLSQGSCGQNGHRDPGDPLLGHASGRFAPEAQRQDAGRSRRRQNAHAGGPGMASARRHARRSPVPLGMPEVYRP